jgi:hypothetical protein
MSRASVRWAKAHPEKMRGYKAAYRDRLRAKIFGHYGHECSCCGSGANLTLDHRDGNGGEHRAELLGNHRRAGTNFYPWVIANGYPPGFQTLCRSCGSSKGNGPACRLDHRMAA